MIEDNNELGYREVWDEGKDDGVIIEGVCEGVVKDSDLVEK
ncbi:hypothetical protein [Staphylococcus epidermidis]|nr:hypothetical protein [Staphylococcus epidermidis]